MDRLPRHAPFSSNFPLFPLNRPRSTSLWVCFHYVDWISSLLADTPRSSIVFPYLEISSRSLPPTAAIHFQRIRLFPRSNIGRESFHTSGQQLVECQRIFGIRAITNIENLRNRLSSLKENRHVSRKINEHGV